MQRKSINNSRSDRLNEEIDAEMGENYEKDYAFVKPVNDSYVFRISRSSLIMYFLYALVFTLLFGAYFEFKENKENKNIRDNMQRKLTINKNPLPHCVKKEHQSVTEHLKCFTDRVQIFVVSDTEQDKEILEWNEYKEYDIHYMNLHHLYTSGKDIMDFLQTFDVSAPWIFVEGSYVGGLKELSEYKDFGVLGNGIENSPIQPLLNQDELNMISSSQMSMNPDFKVDEMKIRKNLRKYLKNNSVRINQFMDSPQKLAEKIQMYNLIQNMMDSQNEMKTSEENNFEMETKQ